MKHRPIIGVTTQSLHAIDGIPPALPPSVVINQRYYVALSNAGATPVLVPLLDHEDVLRGVYDLCDGILLPGGVDMDPSCFGEPPHPKLGRTDPARDRVEMQLTSWAVADGKPVLGLCRGLQVINVALGGSLYQDLEAQCPNGIKHDYFPTYGFSRDHLAHDVTLASGSRLRRMLAHDRVPVNSMHHQGIKTLAPSLSATAVAPDGLVEGVELEGDQFLVGVQWHPEVFEITDTNVRPLFHGFIDAAADFSRRVTSLA